MLHLIFQTLILVDIRPYHSPDLPNSLGKEKLIWCCHWLYDSLILKHCTTLIKRGHPRQGWIEYQNQLFTIFIQKCRGENTFLINNISDNVSSTRYPSVSDLMRPAPDHINVSWHNTPNSPKLGSLSNKFMLAGQNTPKQVTALLGVGWEPWKEYPPFYWGCFPN